LEYLKNIVIHYMNADSASREQLFSSIAAVLHFSKEEDYLHSMATEEKQANEIDMESLDSDDVEEPNVIQLLPSNSQPVQPHYPSRNHG